jgi:hypothetical protein
MLSKLIGWYFKALWWMIIFMAPFFTLWLPIMPIYDWLKPWDEAVVALQKEKQDGLRWMVGFESSSETVNGELTHYLKERDFVVIPSVFTSPTVYEYSEGTNIEKGLKVRPYDAFGYLMMYAGLICFSWFVSVRKIKWLFRFPKSPNQPPQTTPGSSAPLRV